MSPFTVLIICPPSRKGSVGPIGTVRCSCRAHRSTGPPQHWPTAAQGLLQGWSTAGVGGVEGTPFAAARELWIPIQDRRPAVGKQRSSNPRPSMRAGRQGVSWERQPIEKKEEERRECASFLKDSWLRSPAVAPGSDERFLSATPKKGHASSCLMSTKKRQC